MKNKKKIFLTFDLEEWPGGCKYNFDKKFDNSTDFSKKGCLRLLEVLDSYKIKCTFFSTGYFAECVPGLIELLAEKGHEISSHSFYNLNMANMSEQAIGDNIKRANSILQKITGKKVIGFRSPHCYFDPRIIKVLQELNMLYDSSIHPAIVPGYYYNFRCSRRPYYINIADSQDSDNKQQRSLLEIPISVIPLIRFPISWWWMRNMGNWVTEMGSFLNFKQEYDVVLYFHPWEFTNIPKIRGMPFHLTRKCGKKFLHKIELFIKQFIINHKFGVLSEFLNK